jgi:DNA-directed RNA polymerase specialized sigma subunit
MRRSEIHKTTYVVKSIENIILQSLRTTSKVNRSKKDLLKRLLKVLSFKEYRK